MYSITIFWPHGEEEIKYLDFAKLEELVIECQYAEVGYSVL